MEIHPTVDDYLAALGNAYQFSLGKPLVEGENALVHQLEAQITPLLRIADSVPSTERAREPYSVYGTP